MAHPHPLTRSERQRWMGEKNARPIMSGPLGDATQFHSPFLPDAYVRELAVGEVGDRGAARDNPSRQPLLTLTSVYPLKKLYLLEAPFDARQGRWMGLPGGSGHVYYPRAPIP